MNATQQDNYDLVRVYSTGEGETYALRWGLNTMGKSSSNDLTFNSNFCSSRHCQIRVETNGVFLDDFVSIFVIIRY